MRRVAAALVAVLMIPIVAPTEGAGARAGSQASADRVRLVSQTAWVRRGGEFALQVAVETGRQADDVELAVTVHQRVTSRLAFQRTIDGQVGSPITVAVPGTLSELARPGQPIFVRLPVQDIAQPRDTTRVTLRDQGVYPVRVELRQEGGGRVLHSLTTHLLYLPDVEEAPPLGVALVLPVHAPPSVRPDGTRKVAAGVLEGATALAAAVERHSAVPLTLQPTPETLEALATAGGSAGVEVLTSLATSTAAGRHVVGGPFVPVELTEYNGALAPEGAAQLTRGTAVLNERLGMRPDLRTRVVAGRLDAATVARLQEQQVDRLVVPETALAPLDLRVTLAQPFALEGRQGRRPAALAADPGLASHFQRGDDPVLAAHQLLADLTVLWADSPGLVRGVVAVPPRTWRPDRGFLEAVLTALVDSPVLRGATLDQLFERVPAATAQRRTPLVRRLVGPGRSAPPLVDAVRERRRRLEAFGGILDPGAEIFHTIDDVLLASQSADLRRAERTRYLSGVSRLIGQQIDGIRLPGNRSVTLTARRGTIPVTVVSELGYPVHVVIRAASTQLEFPDGAARPVDLVRRNATRSFTVQARTSGSFPLRFTVESPDGGLVLQSSRFTVRSTAASGVGVVLSIGAGWFLLVWWARQIVRSRRARRAARG